MRKWLLAGLRLEDLDLVLWGGGGGGAGLRWFGRVACSGGAVGAAYDVRIDGGQGAGGPGGHGGG